MSGEALAHHLRGLRVNGMRMRRLALHAERGE